MKKTYNLFLFWTSNTAWMSCSHVVFGQNNAIYRDFTIQHGVLPNQIWRVVFPFTEIMGFLNSVIKIPNPKKQKNCVSLLPHSPQHVELPSTTSIFKSIGFYFKLFKKCMIFHPQIFLKKRYSWELYSIAY